jgi:hypothetical protein
MKRLLALLTLVPLSLAITATAAQEGLYTYTNNAGNAMITAYSGSGAVSIPPTLGGLPVTAIHGDAFRYGGATSVHLPASVIDVGEEPFRGCPTTAFTVDGNNPAYSADNGILFNKNFTRIIRYPGERVGSYTIPSSVTSIESGAFGRCNGLTGVTIPASVLSLSSRDFGFSPDLLAITVVPANPNYSSSVEGVLFNKNKTELISYPGARAGSYTIPSSITVIRDQSFSQCYNLTDVTIPTSVTRIEWMAFINSIGLTRLTIPASVTEIEGYAFRGCRSLSRVNFLGNAPTAGVDEIFQDTQVTVYRLAAATGFGAVGSLWNLRPTALWAGVSGTPWNWGLSSLDEDWRRLSWFGDYARMGDDGWIWHNKHGFIFVPPSSEASSIWMYTMDRGWLWTSSSLYPFLYRLQDGAWLWYNGAVPRWFRNFTSGIWENW